MMLTKSMLAKIVGVDYRTILRRCGSGRVDIRRYVEDYHTKEYEAELLYAIIDLLNKKQK